MIIRTKSIHVSYTRPSKLGTYHTYIKKKTIVEISCDSCNSIFERDLGKMDRRRLDNNNYYHVCPNCNPKKFAQQKGARKRSFWNTKVNIDKDITNF